MKLMAITALCATLFASPALAQDTAARPTSPPPAASAPFEEREGWCQAYVGWFISQTSAQEDEMPSDVRATHRFETELSSCKLDPVRFERETDDEVLTAEH